MPTLAELVSNLDSLDDEATIYVAEDSDWTAFSQAVVIEESVHDKLPNEATGMRYFLEVAVAKDVVDTWREWRQGRVPTNQERCEAVIYYAKHDSYLPVS